MRESERLASKGARILTVVHSQAVVAGAAALGPGTVVMAHATVNPDARIGRGAIVNTGAVGPRRVQGLLTRVSCLGVG